MLANSALAACVPAPAAPPPAWLARLKLLPPKLRGRAAAPAVLNASIPDSGAPPTTPADCALPTVSTLPPSPLATACCADAAVAAAASRRWCTAATAAAPLPPPCPPCPPSPKLLPSLGVCRWLTSGSVCCASDADVALLPLARSTSSPPRPWCPLWWRARRTQNQTKSAEQTAKSALAVAMTAICQSGMPPDEASDGGGAAVSGSAAAGVALKARPEMSAGGSDDVSTTCARCTPVAAS